MNFSHLALSAFVASLSTLVVGFIWYHPKVFGTVWMKEEGLTDEQLKQGNMAKIFGLSILFAFLAGFLSLSTIVIHQFGAFGMIGGPNNADKALASFQNFMNDYGTAFRTFKHGALHGVLTGVFLIFPVIAINGLFSHKSWKLILITAGYWVVTLAIMGGVLCGWSDNGFHFV